MAQWELTPPDAQRALERTHRLYPGFHGLSMADSEGNVLAATRRDSAGWIGPETERPSVAGDVWFQEPSRIGKPYLSGVVPAPGQGREPVVILSVPVTSAGGRPLGVLQGTVDLTRLPPATAPPHVRIVALDRAGRIAYSSHPDRGAPLELWAPVRHADGNQLPLSSVRLPMTVPGWQVVASVPVDEIYRPAKAFGRIAIAILLLAAALAWILGRLLARDLTRPILALARQMKIDSPDAPPRPPGFAVAEIRQLEVELHHLRTRFGQTDQQLRSTLLAREQTNAELRERLLTLDRKVAERSSELAESESRYRQLVEHSRDIIFRTDIFGRITFHNAAFAQLLGGDRNRSFIGQSHLALMDLACRGPVRALALEQIRARTSTIYLEYSVTTVDGTTRWFGQSTQLLQGYSRFPLGFQAIARDITGKRMAESALREAEERYALAVRGSNNGIWDWDLRTDFVYFAPRWRQMFGVGPEEPCSSIDDWFSRIHPEDLPGIRSTVRSYVQEGQELFEAEHRMRHADGTWRWILVCGAAVRGPDGRALRIAGSKTDITAGKLADPLTGLPNRLSLLELLECWLDRLREEPARQFAILFLDLDRFKLINDSLGHVKGDHLLLGVSLRLNAALQSIPNADGLVCRLGGDEFVVLIDMAAGPEAPLHLANAVLRAMEPPFHLDGSLVFVTTSIGIAHSTALPSTPESLLRDADTAMYHAKASGRGRYAVFDKSMHARAVARLGLETDLRHASENNEFVLYYQPQADLRNGRLVGFETLIRWQHPTRGLLSPGEFIGVAEENGLILPIGRWVLEQGCRQLAEWDRAHPACHPLSISVNLSARQFTDPSLAAEVARILTDTGLRPSRLHLEVTESMLADDPKVASEILKELSTMGVTLEVDDFGTGYSCLGQLNRLPFDTLKIDRSFVQALDQEKDGHKMIDSIVSLAASLGINVVAEGIETAAHWAYIARLGCQFGQGYFFSRPVAAPDALAIAELRHHTPWPVPEPESQSLQGLAALTEAGPEPVRQ
jgi:diguanylate cyclase (GGDEF)-like protein/PAS domain S-box-containing protein